MVEPYLTGVECFFSIQLGQSLFHWGAAYLTGTRPLYLVLLLCQEIGMVSPDCKNGGQDYTLDKMFGFLLIHHFTMIIPCLLIREMRRLVRHSSGGPDLHSH